MIPFYIFYSMFGMQRVGDLDLGGRRSAHARLPAGRHRGAHDAERRRACSTRTATATCWPPPSPTASPTTRPSPTRWRSSSRTACAAWSRSRRTSSITSPLMNENYPHPAPARGRARGDPQGDVQALRRRRRARGTARAAPRQRRHPARGDRGRRAAEERLGRDRPTSGAAPASTSCGATARAVDALEHAAPDGEAARRRG